MTAPLIDHDVLQATLDHALRGGGDFAEVFVEDRRSSSARFDDGRVEELVSGSRPRRGASRRSRRHDRFRAHGRSLARGIAERGGGGGRRGPRRWRRNAHGCARGHGEPSDRCRRRPARDGREAPQGRAPGPRRCRGPRDGQRGHVGDRVVRRRRAGASSSRTPTASSPTTTACARACRCSASRPATPECRPAHEAPGRTMGFELFDTVAPEDVGRKRGRARAHAARRGAGAVGPAARSC